ncbi:hypothetical protein Barb4_00023 [Bacteroidales bacterium Barb4]|nr:hypothetical protein Barb4_00023 [Bacteroidales bacterium Barb4]
MYVSPIVPAQLTITPDFQLKIRRLAYTEPVQTRHVVFENLLRVYYPQIRFLIRHEIPSSYKRIVVTVS